VTRPSIAAACALSRPTVFAAIERLERLALVTEVGQVSGKPGRAAALYECSASAGALAAIDIGGSNLRVAVTDVRGRILAERREATAPGGGPGVVAQATRLVKSAIRSADTDAGTLVTVAVSVPGVVGHDGGTVYYATNIDQLEPFDFRGALSATLSAPVELENNVNLAAMGEQWRGVARDLSTFVVVAVGAGIGAGIVHDGTLLRGSHGAAGEVAFLPPYGGSLRDHTMRHDRAGGLTLLEEGRACVGWREGVPPGTVEELFHRAAGGEGPATVLVEDECRNIASVIAAICAVIDPEKVILTGGVGANSLLIARAQELIDDTTAFPPPVIRSDLGEDASLIGAIWLATRVARSELLDATA
jgi:glucokinase